MSRIKSIKIQGENGNFSSNIPIGADAANIDMQDGTDVEEKIGLIQHDIIVDSRRLDAIEAGDTSSGDEVVGIRTAVDGTVYANAGTAVRQQVKQITRSTPIVDENDIYKIKHYRYDTGGSVEPPITLDASLSVAGAAADAKATGDGIVNIIEKFQRSLLQIPYANLNVGDNIEVINYNTTKFPYGVVAFASVITDHPQNYFTSFEYLSSGKIKLHVYVNEALITTGTYLDIHILLVSMN